MSRYIDADAVITRIAGQMSYEIELETGNETDCVDLAEELMNDIPSIDIVRCKECRHWWEMTGANYGDCDHFAMDTIADAFCSYGERREP